MEDLRKESNFTFAYKCSKYNYFTCKICNSDTELFPEPFRQIKYSTKIGRLPVCGCYNKYRYSKEEYLILLKRKVRGINAYLEVVDILPDSKRRINAHCIVKIICHKHNNIIESYNINQILSSRSSRLCEDCYWEGVETSKMLEWKMKALQTLSSNNYNHRHILKGSMRIVKDTDYRVIYSCNVCSNILDDTEFSILAHQFCKGRAACSCGKSYNFSMNELTHFVKRTEGSTYKFVNWLNCEGIFTSRRFTYWCNKHGFRHSKFWDWRSGNRCMLCSKTGFDDNKEADLYVIRWSNHNYTGIKIGITNVFESRFNNLNKNSKLTPSILYRFHFDTGIKARKLETDLKQRLIDHPVCLKDLLPDGYTETYTECEHLLETILETIKKEGGYIGFTKY